MGDLGVCESGDVGGVEVLELNRGAPAQRAVASLPIMEDLQVLQDRVGCPWIAQRYRHAGRGYWTIDQVGLRPVLGVGDRAGLPVDLRRGKRSVRQAIRQDRANRVAALVLVEVVRRARPCAHRRSGQCAGLGSVYALVGGLTAGLVYGSASGLVGLIGAVAAGLSGGLRDERVLSERRDPAVGSDRPCRGAARRAIRRVGRRTGLRRGPRVAHRADRRADLRCDLHPGIRRDACLQHYLVRAWLTCDRVAPGGTGDSWKPRCSGCCFGARRYLPVHPSTTARPSSRLIGSATDVGSAPPIPLGA